MAQSQVTVLDDSEVCRMMADKAMHDQVFRDQLLNCVCPNTPQYVQIRRKKFRAVLQTVTRFREQIVDQAGLKAPDLHLKPRAINNYLISNMNSRVLMRKTRSQNDDGTEDTLEEVGGDYGWVGSPIAVARLATSILQSKLRFQADPTPFPFERLPPELRLLVYRKVLIGTVCGQVQRAKVVTVTPIHDRGLISHFRFGGFPKDESREINVSLVAVSRAMNNEAIPTLYQYRTFDFRTNVGAVQPFLCTLSVEARQDLGGICMELHDKKEPHYCCAGLSNAWGKGADNKEAWSTACAYIRKHTSLKHLSLSINMKITADFKALKWIKDLINIKSLKSLTLQANQHPGSGPIEIRASYKDGSVSATDHCFSEHLVPCFEYLREEMLKREETLN